MVEKVIIMGAAGRDFHNFNKPALRVRYEYKDHGSPTLEELIFRHYNELGI